MIDPAKKEESWCANFKATLSKQGLTPQSWLKKNNLTIEDITDPVMLRFFEKHTPKS